MTVTGIAFWFPPVRGIAFENFLFAATIMCLHWLFFTVASVPLTALGPELARSEQGRAKLGSFFGMGMMIGVTFTAVLPGLMVDALDPARHADPPAYSAVGYQRTAIILAVAALVLLQVPAWVLRERHKPSRAAQTASVGRSLGAALTNKPFLMWFAASVLFSLGFLATQKALPYWVELALDGDETLVSLLMIPFVGAAFIALPLMPLLSKRVPAKWIWFGVTVAVTVVLPLMYVIAVMPCARPLKLAVTGVVFAIVGTAQAALFMLFTPLMGQIVDLDERRSGERREGIYVGISGVSWKAAQALSVYVFTVPMNLWGNSPESPTGVFVIGPIAAVFVLMALVIIWFYPVLDGDSESG
jgi:GPH family glycoside/pentoside/hexuronide:cation symporter